MAILPHPAWLTLLCFIPRKFSPPRKGNRVEMGWDFSSKPQGGGEFRLFRPNLPRPAPPHPTPPHPILALPYIDNIDKG